MKKLIAILAVMIVLVGAVFATDTTNTIKITTCINPVEPTFRLNGTSVNYQSHQTDTADVSDTGLVDITDNYLFDHASTTVNFTITQISTSKSYSTYTFSVKASDLRLVEGSDSTSYTFADWANTYDGHDDMILPIDGRGTDGASLDASGYLAIALTAHADYTHIDLEAASGSVSAEYDGHQVVAGESNPAPVELASFSCTWNQNAAAMAGDYEAYVVLTVSAS